MPGPIADQEGKLAHILLSLLRCVEELRLAVLQEPSSSGFENVVTFDAKVLCTCGSESNFESLSADAQLFRGFVCVAG